MVNRTRALAVAIAAGALGISARAEPPVSPRATQTVTIVLNGPHETMAEGPFDVQVRVFEAENPDAPPQVTAMAMKSVPVVSLKLPMAVDLEIPVERLAGAMKPAIGVLVLGKDGRMIYWTDSYQALSRSGSTVVELAPVP